MQKALVTGASGGIGKAIADELARRKVDLLLTARSTDKLQAAALEYEKKYGIRAQIFSADFADPHSPEKLEQFCRQIRFTPDVVVNNAGYGLWGNFHELTLEEQLTMMRVNMDALVGLTYRMIPFLKEHKKSYLLNVSSTTAFQAIPTFAVYAATKSFVLSFTRAIRHELKPFGIGVTCLVPGATDTGFIGRAKLEHIAEKAKKVSMSPEAVAKAGINGLVDGKAEVIPGLINLISAGATNFLPKGMLEKIAAGIYEPK